MQVYANTFEIEGDDAFECVVRALLGWLKQITGRTVNVGEISRRIDQHGVNGRVKWSLKGLSVETEGARLYAWQLKHTDRETPGRQWVVDVGVETRDGVLHFSCSLVAEEQSTLVRNPIRASQPRLIGYVLKNVAESQKAYFSSDVPGREMKVLNNNEDGFRAFKLEVESENRKFPFVLVSHIAGERYPLPAAALQETLFGLAQVVEIARDCDTFEMEQTLGRSFSAWAGAINIIGAPRRGKELSTSLVRLIDIEAAGSAVRDRVGALLERVTHRTNIPHSQACIRLEHVRQLAIRNGLEARLEKVAADAKAGRLDEAALSSILEEQAQAFRRVEEQRDECELKVFEWEEKYQELEDRARALEYKAKSLEGRPRDSDSSATDAEFLVDLVAQGAAPSPEECLRAVALAYASVCIVLESAWESARKLENFQNGRRLLRSLQKLLTEYVDALAEGGDSQARQVFTPEEFSANESETVMRSPTLSTYRRFIYNGQEIEMFKHLKIGRNDNVALTCRVHFAWLANEKRIVIGYCGEHLPISSH